MMNLPATMKKLLLPPIFATVSLLAACASSPPKAPGTTFDFGPLPAATTLPLKGIAVPDVAAPQWMDSTRIYYRLTYADAAQPAAYANSRWVMPATHLWTQRVKQRASQAGAIVVGGEGLRGAPTLKIELDEFAHTFTTAKESKGVVRLRATLLSGREVVAQRTFSQESASVAADAGGGARALIAAGDAAIDAVLAWAASVPAFQPASQPASQPTSQPTAGTR